MKFGYNWPSSSEEKSFEIVDGRRRTTTTDDGACLYYKLPGAFGSGELKICFYRSKIPLIVVPE